MQARILPDYPNVLRAEDFESLWVHSPPLAARKWRSAQIPRPLGRGRLHFGQWNAAERKLENNGNAASAVRLTVQLAENRGNGLSTLFAGVFGSSIIDVEASAVAGKQGVACLMALDPSRMGIELNGDAELDLIGCGAQSNSTDINALKVGGNVRMTTDGICVSGRASIDTNADVTPTPIEYCPQHQDPLAGFVAPPIFGCTDNNVEYSDQDVTLIGYRVFCGGLKITGNSKVTLLPGLYIIDGGKLEIQDDALLEGDGVTIFLHGDTAEFAIMKSGGASSYCTDLRPFEGGLDRAGSGRRQR